MAKKPPDKAAFERLTGALEEVVGIASSTTSDTVSRRIRGELGRFADLVEAARESTDKIRLPKVTFDPFEPKTVGRMVALALLAQPRVPPE